MITRRRVGQVLAACCGAGFPTLTLSSNQRVENDAAAAIGSRVVERVRVLSDRHGAIEALRVSMSQCRVGDDLPGRWAELVTFDFAHGHTVLVDGWQLSRSEAAYCALAFFDQNAT